MTTMLKASFSVGWSQADITPQQPVFLAGQFYARISEGVKTPIVATVMAMQSEPTETRPGSSAILISCDLVSVPASLIERVREALRQSLPDFDSRALIINATHTHAAPYAHDKPRYEEQGQTNDFPYTFDLPAMKPRQFLDFAVPRIVQAAEQAWRSRAPAGISHALGHAVVGHNRIVSFNDGKSRMYASCNSPDFSNMEGYEDHSLRLLGSFDEQGQLTGLIVNLACPTQSDEHSWQISADYWHNIRSEIMRRHGVLALAQVSAAGDQSPHNRFLPNARMEAEMLARSGLSVQEEIARRVVSEVDRLLPLMRLKIDRAPKFEHRSELLMLPRRMIPEADALAARQQSEELRPEYEGLLAEFAANADLRHDKTWYTKATRMRSVYNRAMTVQRRFELQKSRPSFPVELHVLRLGDAAMAFNPFELYLDYGMQIQAWSLALQTFVVQLAGEGSYLPTARSIAGGAYGAVPASTNTGVEGAKRIVDWSVNSINELCAADRRRFNVPRLQKEPQPGLGLQEDCGLLEIQLDNPRANSSAAIKAVLRLGCWQDRLYMSVLVEDSLHFNQNHSGKGLWNGDALQFKLLSVDKEPLLHLILAGIESGFASELLEGDPEALAAARLSMTRNEEDSLSFYEAVLPLKQLKLEGPEAVFRMNMVVFNDNTGQGQDNKWLSLDEGLAGGYHPDLFSFFTLQK